MTVRTARFIPMKINLKARAEKLKTDIPAVFLSLKDKKTPLLAKILAFLAVAYAVSPIDLIPDFIPVIGYLDDLILLPLIIAASIKLIPKEIWEKNRAAAENLWNGKIPVKWYYAVPVVLFWILIAWIIIKAIFL